MSVMAIDACRAVNDVRGDSIVVATMGALNALDSLGGDHPLMVGCVPLMGGSGALGLGLALARPERKVIVLDGDSSLLMELGVLSTIADAAPANYIHVVFANGVQFGGSSNTPIPGRGEADFVAIAKGAGFRHVRRAETMEEFEALLTEAMSAPGPFFCELAVKAPAARLSALQPQPEIAGGRFPRLGDEGRRIREVLSTNG